MAQTKGIVVGFGGYEVLSLNVVSTGITSKEFRVGTAQKILVKNGSKPVNIWLNKPTNDKILIGANETLELPIKTKVIYMQCPQAGDSTTVNVIGFYE